MLYKHPKTQKKKSKKRTRTAKPSIFNIIKIIEGNIDDTVTTAKVRRGMKKR